MDDRLLVRVYNVGLGDCIYVRVPDAGGTKHLLIDCGNKYGSEERLRAAIADLETRLPETPAGKRRLDLLVATHAHEDHVRGFSTELFANVEIARLWLSAAMDPAHPQAEGARALRAFALRALERLALSPRPALAGWAASMLALSKAEGMDALLDDFPAGERRFVDADTPPEELTLFEDPQVRLRVLAPMRDIDRYYLGETATALAEFQALTAAAGEGEASGASEAGAGGGEPAAAPAAPANVSPEDFALLRTSLTDNALAFVLEAGHLVNNTSVVLLLEWHGRRLLFTGDAEVKTAFGGEYREARSNGSWNVMRHVFPEELSRPVDFLKVGHHGSHNATPWALTRGGTEHPVSAILDHLLPRPAEGEPPPARYAVVSTERTSGYPTIPDPALMAELGRRTANVRGYNEPTDKQHFVPAGVSQPQRTDLEQTAGGERVPWIDVELEAVT